MGDLTVALSHERGHTHARTHTHTHTQAHLYRIATQILVSPSQWGLTVACRKRAFARLRSTVYKQSGARKKEN